MSFDMILIILIAVLWRLGGWDKARWSGYRDVLVPLVLGICIAWHYGWLPGLLCAATLNIIRVGYGNYDPEFDLKPSLLAELTHDRNGWWIRGIVGALYVLIGLLPLAISTGHWWQYAFAAAANALVNFTLCRLRAIDWIIEPAVGATLAAIVLFF